MLQAFYQRHGRLERRPAASSGTRRVAVGRRHCLVHVTAAANGISMIAIRRQELIGGTPCQTSSRGLVPTSLPRDRGIGSLSTPTGERGEWWLGGDAWPWQPDGVNVLSDKLVFRPRLNAGCGTRPLASGSHLAVRVGAAVATASVGPPDVLRGGATAPKVKFGLGATRVGLPASQVDAVPIPPR